MLFTGSDPHGIEILCMVGGGRGWVRGEQVPNFETAKKQVPNHEKKIGDFRRRQHSRLSERVFRVEKRAKISAPAAG